MSERTLVVLPGLGAVQTAAGRLVLTRKFVDGMEGYADRWKGRVVALMHPLVQRSSNLDNVEVDPRDLPFRVEVVEYGSNEMWRRLRTASLVLGGPDHRLRGLARRLRALGVASVYCTEYTLETRLQWIRAESNNPFLIARRVAWEVQNERAVVRDLPFAQGVQCNGTPTYEAYGARSPSPLLFFDTRARKALYATPGSIDRRAESLRRGRRLRLAFSGRLIRAKGADHLVSVARALERLGVPFEMAICGGGELAQVLRQRISDEHLQKQVRLVGVLDFETELVPFLRESVDLFVVPHRQGDPSCAYLETLSLGVPIVGYANASFAGILDRAPVGWSVPSGRPFELAKTIALLDLRRERIIERSHAALGFALGHSFEKTFDQRVEHLERASGDR